MSANQLVARGNGVYEVDGGMTFQTVPEFSAHGFEAATTIDLSKAAPVDSAGVALMLEWMAAARAQQRELRFVNFTEPLQHLIGVSGLAKAFGL